jgi:hypothetical protein
MSIDGTSTPVITGQVQFVIGAEGKPTGVLLDIATWERVLHALEDAEDLAIAKQALAELAAAGGDPEKAGYLVWEQVRAELDAEDAQE